MRTYPSILLFVISLIWMFRSLSAADCGDSNQRSVEVAMACEADFDMGSEGLEACPPDCLIKLTAYYEDCERDIKDLYFLVIGTDKDACWDEVFGFYSDLPGSDCEKNREAYGSLWPLVCLYGCSEDCEKLVNGVCTNCEAKLIQDMASAVETQLSSTSSCPQSTCDLRNNGSNSEFESSSGDSAAPGSIGTTAFSPTGTISEGDKRANSVPVAVALSILSSLALLLECW